MQYSVFVKFSSDNRIEVKGNEISISVKSLPERGRANRELVKKLAIHFGVEEGRVRIVSGITSRKKIIEIV